mgnify:CR=1 FL=1|jgi:hypothetical protein
MKDLFESYKSNIRYSVVAELKIVNSEPVFSYDKYGLFENPHLRDEWKIILPWKRRAKELDCNFLHAIFFMNGVLIEEHNFSLPPLDLEGDYVWWGHNHLQRLLKGLNIKFYGR